MPRYSTCLWFANGDALEAARFYETLFDDARVITPAAANPEKPPLIVEFTLGDTHYTALNGGPMFTLSEAVSIMVTARDQAEVDRLWAALTADGGAESMCGWLKDRFGLSWQIIPKLFYELMASDDATAKARVMAALMQMKKIDCNKLRTAFDGP